MNIFQDRPYVSPQNKSQNLKRKLESNTLYEYRYKNSPKHTSKPKPSNILEGLYTMTKWDLSQKCKDGLIYENEWNTPYELKRQEAYDHVMGREKGLTNLSK